VILDDLRRYARDRPQDPAVIALSGGGEVTQLSWAELAAEVQRSAANLLGLGVGAGDPVAFQLPNRLEFVTLTLAILSAGGVCEPLMPIFRERELEFMLRASGARVLFVPGSFRGLDYAAMGRSLRDALPALEHVVVVDEGGFAAAAGDERSAPPPPQADALAQLLFTSGSTGEPKGVLHRHCTLMRAADAHIRHFGLGQHDVIYVPSPLAHQTGFLYGMWIALRLGVTQVLQEVWDPETAFEAMQRFRTTFVQAATPFLADLVRVARERGEPPEALEIFVSTGAAIPRDLVREARKALGAEVGGAWGATESCLGTAFVPGDPPERAWSTDGRALADVTIRVVDDDGWTLPPNAEGHFEVRTGCLFEGYLNRPDLTAEAVTDDGFYRTGDLARIDEHGYLRITGRIKDVINRGGEKIPVKEIEELLYAHPAVRDAAIVAMPDERLGERACAFVVLEPEGRFDFETMLEHLDRRRVSKTYWPERLEVIDELPKTPSGKIQKFRLRDQAAQRKAIPT
jgi:3-phosphoshikimate 1-carboxyvinyltransferase